MKKTVKQASQTIFTPDFQPVACVDENGKVYQVYKSIKEAAETTGCTEADICDDLYFNKNGRWKKTDKKEYRKFHSKKEWRPVAGFDKYEVSNYGEVRNVETGRILAPSTHNCGYLKYGLWKNGELSSRYAHRLVAEAFLPNPDNHRTVNHIDGCKKNNHLFNLQWASDSENISHYIEAGGMHRVPRPVICYDAKTLEPLCVYPSAKEAKRVTGVSLNTIYNSCHNQTKARKYKWAYVDNQPVNKNTRNQTYAPTHIRHIPVMKLDPVSKKPLAIYPSIKDAAEQNDMNVNSIYRVLSGQMHTGGGFCWQKA